MSDATLDPRAVKASRAAYQSAIPDGPWHADGGETDTPIRGAITAYLAALSQPQAGEPVQDTWFTDRALPVMAMSGDVEDNRVLRLHFRRPITDDDRKTMCDALNVHQASLASQPTLAVKGRPERVQAAFEVFKGKSDCGPNAAALFEYIEQLEAALVASPPPSGEGVCERIADTVLEWMVKHDLLDADNEYNENDILEVLKDLAPVSGTRPSGEVMLDEADPVIVSLRSVPISVFGQSSPTHLSMNEAAEVFRIVRAALSVAPATADGWRTMDSAPKDGTFVILKVRPGNAENEGWTPFADSSDPYTTIGFNALADTLEDVWQFAGWDWCHDCFTDGAGIVEGWMPLPTAPTATGGR